MKKYIECCRRECRVDIPIDRCVDYKEGHGYYCSECLKKDHSPDIYNMFKGWADGPEPSESDSNESL